MHGARASRGREDALSVAQVNVIAQDRVSRDWFNARFVARYPSPWVNHHLKQRYFGLQLDPFKEKRFLIWQENWDDYITHMHAISKLIEVISIKPSIKIKFG